MAMRTLTGLLIAAAFGSGGYAQSARGFNPQPYVTGGFPNVVFPGGTAATTGGVTRSFGNVVYPGGGGPRLVVPHSFSDPTRPSAGYVGGSRVLGVAPPRRSRATAAVIPYAVPVYVGGGYGVGGYGYDTAPPPEEAAAPPQQPNVIVIYANPPQPQPTVVERAPLPPPVQPSADADTAFEAPHYLIAFKDHTIYSAVAYYVEGDTLHYFTTGNTHNQVSLSLIDKDLTERLNRETGANVKLPR